MTSVEGSMIKMGSTSQMDATEKFKKGLLIWSSVSFTSFNLSFVFPQMLVPMP